MSRYLITNRITSEKQEVEASSAQEACERVKWMIGDCHVKKMGEPTRKGEVAREAFWQVSNALGVLEQYIDNKEWDTELIKVSERIEKVERALDKIAKRGKA